MIGSYRRDKNKHHKIIWGHPAFLLFINLFSGTAQESRTNLSVHDPVRSLHPLQFCFGVQFAKPLHGLYSSGQASVVPFLECCVAHLAMLLTFEFAGPMKARSMKSIKIYENQCGRELPIEDRL